MCTLNAKELEVDGGVQYSSTDGTRWNIKRWTGTSGDSGKFNKQNKVGGSDPFRELQPTLHYAREAKPSGLAAVGAHNTGNTGNACAGAHLDSTRSNGRNLPTVCRPNTVRGCDERRGDEIVLRRPAIRTIRFVWKSVVRIWRTTFAPTHIGRLTRESEFEKHTSHHKANVKKLFAFGVSTAKRRCEKKVKKT